MVFSEGMRDQLNLPRAPGQLVWPQLKFGKLERLSQPNFVQSPASLSGRDECLGC